MMRLLGLGAVVLLGMVHSAHAFSIAVETLGDTEYEVKWGDPNLPYELDANGSKDITDGSDLAAVRSAIQSWNGVPCSTINFIEIGTTAETDTVYTTSELDGINRLAWVEDMRWQAGAWVLALTTPIYGFDGTITEADIAFNGLDLTWDTSGDYGTTDVESVTVHELGHFIGLQHVLGGDRLGDPPTMAPIIDPYLRTRDLSEDDSLAACYLYPVVEYACQLDCDCPRIVGKERDQREWYSGERRCLNGRCAGTHPISLGGVGVGGGCTAEEDCAGSLTCLGTTEVGSYCVQTCIHGVRGCPDGYTCHMYEESEVGACLPPGLEDGQGYSDGACLASFHRDEGSDTEGLCDCDFYVGCEEECSCDPDCQEGCGCGATGGPEAAVWLGLMTLLMGLFRGRLRRAV